MKNKFFGSTVSYFLFVLLFSIILVFSVSVSNVMGAIYDDFDGGNINENLWNIYDGSILSQSGGLLQADGPPNFVYGTLGSTNTFRGDFEFVLDYRNFQSTATAFVENGPNISIQVQDAFPEENFIYIFRMLLNGNHTFGSNGMLGGISPNGFWAPASTTSGQLKISRTDSTITTFFNEGSGWINLGTFPGAFTGDVRVQIQAYTGDNGTFHVSSDWITYEGHMLSSDPTPDIQANGSDGPVTVSQSEPLSIAINLNAAGITDNADWWVLANTPVGWYRLTVPGGWGPGISVTHQGPLFDLPSFTALNATGLPLGNYTFYFGVDAVVNGTIDMGSMVHDSVDVNIAEPSTCGAYVAPEVWKEFDCYNLAAIGKTTNDDPFTPSWQLIGGYWQWGRKGPDSNQWYDTNTANFAHGPTGPDVEHLNSETISNWDENDAPDGSWSDTSKTTNDPCPAGYRVPTNSQWDGVRNNNIQSTVGTWDGDPTNYSSAYFFGNDLMLPAAGVRLYYSGSLSTRGFYGDYWSSTQTTSLTAWQLDFGSGYAGTYNSHRRNGFSVRCVAE